MNKKMIAPIVLALVLAFGLGMFVRSERAEAPTDEINSFGGEGTATAQPLPEVLQEKAASTTTPTPPAATKATATKLLGGNSSVAPTTLTYTSPFGFSFSYDSRLQTENAWIVLTGGYRISSLAVVRYVKEQHCGLSGLPEHCRPYLENPAIAFGVIEKAPKDVVKDHLDVFAEYLEPVTINGITAAQYYAGVEGEGVVTILVPLKNSSQTLLVQYTYDTLFDDNDTHKGTLTSKEQKIIVDSVLNTLKVL